MLNMENKYKLEKHDGCCLTYNVEVKDNDFREVEQDAIIRVQKEVTYPGFRKGKVPVDIIKKHFYDAVKSEMRDIVAHKVLNDIFEKEKIMPVVNPAVFDFKFDENNSQMSFKLYIEEAPKFEPKEYTGINVVKKVKEIKDEDIDRYIREIREYNAYLKPVENGSVSKNNYIVVDYEVWEGDKKIDEVKGEIIDMSASQNIIGFEEAVTGSKKGETKEFETEFNGKKLKFTVKINEIKEKVIPEIDENFLKMLGVKDESELREQVRKILESQEEEKSMKSVIEQIENHLISKNEFPLPPTLVRQEMEELFEMVKKRISPQEAEKLQFKDYEEKLKPIAERNLKITYLLHSIANKENIKATEDDFYTEMDKVISRLKNENDINKAKELFNQRKSYIMASILENKTFEFIKSKANIKEEKI